MEKPIMMTCGHTANAKTSDGKPCCVICSCYTVDETKTLPDLTGRFAECTDCRKTVPSRFNLPFFQHRPNQQTDTYYCGCFGWD